MEALCGTGFTILLAAISPAKRHFDETANTLNFAAKCGSIPRQLACNEPEHQRELRQLQETVNELRSEISLLKEAKEFRNQGSHIHHGAAENSDVDFSCPGSVACEEQAEPNAPVSRDLQALWAELQQERIRNDSWLHDVTCVTQTQEYGVH